MSTRFLLAFAGFLTIVGSGSLWLYFNIIKKRNLLKSLLSLPKERRFFWYKLRKANFLVLSQNLTRDFSVFTGGIQNNYTLKIDFLVKKNGRKFAGLFSPEMDDKEILKLFFVYCQVFRVKGVIFYDVNTRDFTIWEK